MSAEQVAVEKLAIFLLGYFFGVGVSLFCLAVIGVPW